MNTGMRNTFHQTDEQWGSRDRLIPKTLTRNAITFGIYLAHHAFGAAGRPVTKQEGSLDHVKARTLVLVGRDDWICPVAEAQRLNKGVQNSRLVVLEKSGHFPWIEAPKQFFAEVNQFAK